MNRGIMVFRKGIVAASARCCEGEKLRLVDVFLHFRSEFGVYKSYADVVAWYALYTRCPQDVEIEFMNSFCIQQSSQCC